MRYRKTAKHRTKQGPMFRPGQNVVITKGRLKDQTGTIARRLNHGWWRVELDGHLRTFDFRSTYLAAERMVL